MKRAESGAWRSPQPVRHSGRRLRKFGAVPLAVGLGVGAAAYTAIPGVADVPVSAPPVTTPASLPPVTAPTAPTTPTIPQLPIPLPGNTTSTAHLSTSTTVPQLPPMSLPPPVGTAAGASPPPNPGDRLRSEVSFRSAFALNTDSTYVAAVMADPANEARGATYHVALTTPEFDDVSTKLDGRHALTSAEDGLHSQLGDAYGGSYVDHGQGGTVFVGKIGRASW